MIKFSALVLLSLVNFGKSHFDELQLSCHAHSRCEVFDACTKQAMSQIKLEMNKLIDERFNETKKLIASKGENTSNDKQLDKDVIQRIKLEIQTDLEEKMSQKLNEMEEKIIVSLQQFITKKYMKEQNELDEMLETKVQEKMSIMSVSVKKAQSDSDVANQKGRSSLKSDTKELINEKFSEISASWTKELKETKLDLTEAISNVTKTMHIKISNTVGKITKISERCNKSMEEVHININEQLEKLPKENLTLAGIERIIDSKFDVASEEWWKVFDDNSTYKIDKTAPLNISYNGKQFWIGKSDVAIPFNKGVKICEIQGGYISTIYDNEHMNLMTEFLRRMIEIRRMYIDVWLGITVDPRSGDVSHKYTADNSVFIEWAPESQHLGRSFKSWTGVYLVVKKDVKDKHQGMVNSSPESIRDGVLCEAKI